MGIAMMERCLWLLIKPAEDLPSQWVAHCLDLDIVSQGNSPRQAYNMAIEAVQLMLNDSRERNLAPAAYWSDMAQIIASDTRLALDAALLSYSAAIATVLLIDNNTVTRLPGFQCFLKKKDAANAK